MSRHVHLLPPDRVETHCVAQALREAGIEARVGAAENECVAVVVVLALDDIALETLLARALRDGVCRPMLLLTHDPDMTHGMLREHGTVVAVASLSEDTATLVGRVLGLLGEARVPRRETPGQGGRPGDGLTRRELEVASMLAGGWRNDEIARQLGISSHTVRTHAQRVLLKLDVQHRQALAAKLPRGVTIPRPRRTATRDTADAIAEVR